MTYNKPYYGEFLERLGFGKRMDLYAYRLPTKEVSQKSLDLSARIEERLKRKGITIRTVNMKKFKGLCSRARGKENWLFLMSP